MIRTLTMCDHCGKEITEDNIGIDKHHPVLTVVEFHTTLLIILPHELSLNAATDICKQCIMSVIQSDLFPIVESHNLDDPRTTTMGCVITES